ncbi:MAG: efflux RND transporter periplasmic adaptor subunit [Longimicrobiales bacterium]
MKHTKRILTGMVILAVLSAAGFGVYKRVNSARAADGRASDSTMTDVPDVASATGQFDPNEPVPVEGTAVLHGDLVLTVNAAGQAASRRPTILKSQVGGQIRSVVVRENSVAGAGQVLITIDPTEYQLALAEAKAGLRSANATFQELTIGDDKIKDQALLKERREAARDRARVESAEVAVLKAQMNLDRTQVKAPFGGRIANLKVVSGQFVNAGEELLTVQEMDPIRVDVQVMEGQIGTISSGRPADVTFAAFPGITFAGRVETINPIVDQVTRTARVTVAVANRAGRILPGMYARVRLSAERLPDRTYVPVSAVVERDNHRKLVFVFKPDSEGSDVGRADWRYVTVGQQNAEYIEIVPNPEMPGVQPGEIVLTAGHNSLTHDGRVKLTQHAKLVGGRPQ